MLKLIRNLLAICLMAFVAGAWAQAQPLADVPDAGALSAQRSLAADKVCTACHDEGEAKPVLAIYKTPHGVKADARTPGCQSCHGASAAHVKNAQGLSTRPAPDVSFKAKVGDVASQRQACIGCHKGGQRQHWDGSQHDNAGVACTACHQVHAHKDKVLVRGQQQEVCYACHQAQRGLMHRQSHHPVEEGKMACSDCHNPHGSVGPKLMKKDSINETCFTCHAERRGPFLHEHEPVTENCANCHNPHGSNTNAMLKQRTPYLCQSCHSGDHAKEANSGANLQTGAATTANGTVSSNAVGAIPRAQMAGRNCLSCHMQVHGSNHPAGAKLQR